MEGLLPKIKTAKGPENPRTEEAIETLNTKLVIRFEWNGKSLFGLPVLLLCPGIIPNSIHQQQQKVKQHGHLVSELCC